MKFVSEEIDFGQISTKESSEVRLQEGTQGGCY